MYYKGVVVEILEKYAILLTRDGEFIRVKKIEGLEVGQTILCLKEDIIKKEVKVIPFSRKVTPILAAIAACFLFLLVPAFKGSATYAVLSVDVNPSFELELDDQMVVIRVNELNNSAKSLNLKQLKGLPLEAALENLYEIFMKHNIDLSQNPMLISLAMLVNDDYDYEERVKSSLQTVPLSQEVAYLKVTKEELEQAKDQKLSAAKLKAKLMLGMDDIEDLSVDEIIRLFNELNLRFDFLSKDGKIINYDELEDTIDDILDELEDQADSDNDDQDDKLDEIEESFEDQDDDLEETNDDFDDQDDYDEPDDDFEDQSNDDNIEIDELEDTDNDDDSDEWTQSVNIDDDESESESEEDSDDDFENESDED